MPFKRFLLADSSLQAVRPACTGQYAYMGLAPSPIYIAIPRYLPLTGIDDMDPSLYKDINIGEFKYHYYYHPAKAANPTLLFIHGFPSFSELWVNQVVYFKNKGHGVIALDMLGYAGTSKVLDYKLYSRSAMAAHCVAILDAEGLDKVIVVSHDWGCSVGSKLANIYPERHLGSVFLNISYRPPTPDLKLLPNLLQTMLTLSNSQEDSFYSLAYAGDPTVWEDAIAEGGMEKWLLADRKVPVGLWAPDQNRHNEIFRAGGWVGPTNWYRSAAHGVILEDDKDIPKERYTITHPVLQILCPRDAICVPDLMRVSTVAWCTNATIRELDTGHWPMFEKPDELHAAMDEFMAGL
ncbi:alpha/beta-hydrolase [Ramaria rubella]|nr:alpha/beta-hydrolase [Ramaria rubella]